MKVLAHSLLISLLFQTGVLSQIRRDQINPDLLERHWSAYWITAPEVSLKDFAVLHFRKTFELSFKPDRFLIHLSADNRYRFFVNGSAASQGPSRGDLANWRFESVDIAPWLKVGRNVLAAVVWNFGEQTPWAQITFQTGLIVQGDSKAEQVVNTNRSWRVITSRAYSPIRPQVGNEFIVVGPGERLDASLHHWGWELPENSDRAWLDARQLDIGTPRGVGTDLQRLLVPREIPQMEESPLRFGKVARSQGVYLDQGFLDGEPLRVPANSEVRILLDQQYLVTAYPELKVSGGKGSVISLAYGEALFGKDSQKGNRDDIQDRSIIGIRDEFIADGGKSRRFRPLWFRTFRYVQLDIKTADDPLQLEEISSVFTAYPFRQNAHFESSEIRLQEVWDVGWRTARLCAGETYFDCPYYEQLQYVGDTRIQALISLYVSGDDRLVRKALRLFDDSRLPNGLTQSRYPSLIPQIIPPYSLFWVSMVYDYWMHRDDPDFVESFLPGIQGVLKWYEQHLSESGLLGRMPWWNFVDWTVEWPWNNDLRIGGVPPGGSEGQSSIISLHFAYTLEQAAGLFETFGRIEQANDYRKMAGELEKQTLQLCWNDSRKMLADTPEQNSFSQHANIFAILSDAVPPEDQSSLMNRILSDEKLVQSTFYFKFYLFQALKKCGMADSYLTLLEPWHEMLNLGLTTFAEKPEPTRSDCHAWSASPLYDFLSTVLGINPAEPGFKSVRINPSLGRLAWAKGSVPHPAGEIQVDFKRSGTRGLVGDITLPPGLTGILEWQEQRVKLKSGTQKIQLEESGN